MDVPTLLARDHRSVVSSGVRSAARRPCARLSDVPGDHRLEVHEPERRRLTEDLRVRMSIGPNLCAFAGEDDDEVLMAAEADVASALEDAARTRARRGSIARGRAARSCAARMSTPGRCDVPGRVDITSF